MMAASLKRAYFDAAKVTDEQIAKYARYYDLPGSKRAMVRAAQQIVPEKFEEFCPMRPAAAVRLLFCCMVLLHRR